MDNKDIIINALQEPLSKRRASYWYSGKVVELIYKNYTFCISAVGIINATLYSDGGEEIEHVKDKGNYGRFYEQMSYYIESDTKLFDLVEKQKLVFYDSNWWECGVIDPLGNWVDLPWVLDSMLLDDAIDEVKEAMDKTIELLENE